MTLSTDTSLSMEQHLSINKLQGEQILYAENVASLRSAIAHKYPHASSKERADLLAKAMKRILAANLSSFEESIKTSLVQDLLRTALQKQDFSVNAHDVIASYTTLDQPTSGDLTPLTTWLSDTTGTTISAQELSQALSPHTSPETVLEPNAALDPSSQEDNASSSQAFETADKGTPADTPTPSIPYKKVLFTAGTLCITASTILLITNLNPATPQISPETPLPTATIEAPLTFLIAEADYLLPHLQYKKINQTALQEWLIGRDSILADEPYFSTMIDAAMQHNINPLLMFAITGQEQGFVPKTNKRALEIANNPFNVYGSWQDFNTDIKDTAFIAARTIINLSKGCPKDADPIKWLNQKYAEDPNWHKGVTYFLEKLEEIAG